MKAGKELLLSCLLIWLGFGIQAANTDESKRDKVISTAVGDNLYIAGSSITIDAVIGGDLTAAGWAIHINDSILDDLLVAGANIHINGVLADDAKIAGKDIQISKNVHGDLVISGASVQIDQDVVVDKNLMIFAGEATISGTVKGNVKISGGSITFDGTALKELRIQADELELNGSINGPATIVSNQIEVGEFLELNDQVHYWSKQQVPNLTANADGAVNFDEELDPSKQGAEWSHFGLDRITYWLLYILSTILIMTILVVMFNKVFQRAGDQVNHTVIKNFGYGILYFVGLLLLSIISFVVVIGIPIGLVTLVILIFSLLFAKAIGSMVLAYGINIRFEKNWNKWGIIFTAVLVFLVFKLVGLIPFAGSLGVVILIVIAFGALLLSHIQWKRTLATEL